MNRRSENRRFFPHLTGENHIFSFRQTQSFPIAKDANSPSKKRRLLFCRAALSASFFRCQYFFTARHLIPCPMYRQLREREINAGFIERLVYILISVKKNIPIISAFHPYADHEIDAAIGQLIQSYLRSRIS